MDLGITGRKAIVCAASKGLGRACAFSLAHNGVDVTIVARTREALESTAEEIRREAGVRVVAVAEDITTAKGREAALNACPQPDILVNNAGGPPPGDFHDWSREDWIRALDANMLDAYRADQGHGGWHDGPRLWQDREHHIERREGADRHSRIVEWSEVRADRLRRRHRSKDGT